MKIWKWLYPGIGVKRWLLLHIAGLLLVFSGISLIFKFHFIDYLYEKFIQFLYFITGIRIQHINIFLGLIILSSGIIFMFISLNKIAKGIKREFMTERELVDVLYQKKILEKGPEVVAFGGGTGLSSFLRGIKKYTSNITAIVTVADDGGSSGKLRDEMGILPPGDIRNCLVALADREPLMEKLFQYRFRKEGELSGHSFGNLFIGTMTKVLGDFEAAVKESSKVLAVKGQVLPATNEDIHLGAIYKDNSIKMGESVIPSSHKKIKRVFLKPDNCEPTADSLTAIKKADIIVIGPGSLYTSILPNLLIRGITEAIRDSHAIKIYICNIMTQPGETTGYTATDHIQAIYDHIGEGIFDYIIVNREIVNKKMQKRYKLEGAYPVKVNKKRLTDMGLKIIEEDLLSNEDYARHDPDCLAQVILKIVER